MEDREQRLESDTSRDHDVSTRNVQPMRQAHLGGMRPPHRTGAGRRSDRAALRVPASEIASGAARRESQQRAPGQL